MLRACLKKKEAGSGVFSLVDFVTSFRFLQRLGFVFVSFVPKAQPYINPGGSGARNEWSENPIQ